MDGFIKVNDMIAFHGDLIVYKYGTEEVLKTIKDTDFICPGNGLWYDENDTYQMSYCKAIPYTNSEGCPGSTINIGGWTFSPCEYELDEVIENCTVEILKCKKCGNFSVGWRRDSYEGT